MLAIRKIRVGILSIMFLAGFSLLAPRLTLAGLPPWAPAYGHRAKHKKNVVYKYIYYPSSQVYFSPVRGGYYYPYASGWRYGVSLPSGIRLGNGVSIELNGPTPYVYHPTVIQRYPVVIP